MPPTNSPMAGPRWETDAGGSEDIGMIIDREATPIAHVSPYRRIDPCHPGRKSVITMMEVLNNGGKPPDAALYSYDFLREA
jgi:hypothetical protein